MGARKSRRTGTTPVEPGGAVPDEPVNRSEFNPAHAALIEPFIRRLLPDLVGAEFEVEDRWREGTDRGAIYPSECYYRAARYVYHLTRLTVDGVWLVHGENLVGAGRHAWVELPGEVVFDAVLQRFYDKTGYYTRTHASPWYKYTPFAAAIIPIHLPKYTNGNACYGNWHEYLGLPWADPAAPDEIDDDRAIELLTARGYFSPTPVRRRKRNR